MPNNITIICHSCDRKVLTPRCGTDPDEAVVLRGIICPDCDNGGFDLPMYFDVLGNQVFNDH